MEKGNGKAISESESRANVIYFALAQALHDLPEEAIEASALLAALGALTEHVLRFVPEFARTEVTQFWVATLQRNTRTGEPEASAFGFGTRH